MAVVGKSIQIVFDEEEAGGEPDIKGLNNFELIRLPFLSFCKLGNRIGQICPNGRSEHATAPIKR
jgi:hypothetical protein